ncbi:hypothetical protein AVEN_78189-1 [Araneus ventricosus]|uniref:Uncharacterized protein n=1 Tax=Araneus ventricosus TaxID=182803 RepID=A0A4Y2MT48_ARAVE|nr:hypothetical protein AVEN_78189-1 [Araneus ventricosus]
MLSNGQFLSILFSLAKYPEEKGLQSSKIRPKEFDESHVPITLSVQILKNQRECNPVHFPCKVFLERILQSRKIRPRQFDESHVPTALSIQISKNHRKRSNVHFPWEVSREKVLQS